MTSGSFDPGEIGAVYISVLPSLSGATGAMTKGGETGAEAYSKGWASKVKEGLHKGIEHLPSLSDTFGKLGGDASKTFSDKFNDATKSALGGVGTQLADKFGQEFGSQLGRAVGDWARDIDLPVVGKLGDAFDLVSTGAQAATKSISGVSDAISRAKVGDFGGALTDVNKVLGDLEPLTKAFGIDLSDLGVDLSGLPQPLQDVTTQASSFVDTFTDAKGAIKETTEVLGDLVADSPAITAALAAIGDAAGPIALLAAGITTIYEGLPGIGGGLKDILNAPGPTKGFNSPIPANEQPPAAQNTLPMPGQQQVVAPPPGAPPGTTYQATPGSLDPFAALLPAGTPPPDMSKLPEIAPPDTGGYVTTPPSPVTLPAPPSKPAPPPSGIPAPAAVAPPSPYRVPSPAAAPSVRASASSSGSRADVAKYIYQSALSRGYSPDDATAIVAYAIGESGLNPQISGGQQGDDVVIGLFQEKSGFARAGGIDPSQRGTVEGNTQAYLNNLAKHRGQGDIMDQLLATSVGGPMYTGGRAAMSSLVAQARELLGGAGGGDGFAGASGSSGTVPKGTEHDPVFIRPAGMSGSGQGATAPGTFGGDKDSQQGSQLGMGLSKGVLQGLGFPDVFGKGPFQWGSVKAGMGVLGYGLNLMKRHGSILPGASPGYDNLRGVLPNGETVGLEGGEGIIKPSAMKIPGMPSLLNAANHFDQGGVVDEGLSENPAPTGQLSEGNNTGGFTGASASVPSTGGGNKVGDTGSAVSQGMGAAYAGIAMVLQAISVGASDAYHESKIMSNQPKWLLAENAKNKQLHEQKMQEMHKQQADHMKRGNADVANQMTAKPKQYDSVAHPQLQSVTGAVFNINNDGLMSPKDADRTVHSAMTSSTRHTPSAINPSITQ